MRRSDGTNEDGRPPLSSRKNSENPTASNQRAQTPRPGYSRSNSHLPDVKEKKNEQGKKEASSEAKESQLENEPKRDVPKNNDVRPGLGTLTSHSGVDVDDVEPSLKNPPTEYFAEAHPESTEDHRYRETKSIANQVTPPPAEGYDDRIQFSETGETQRQGAAARKAHEAQETRRSEDKRTLLLVEDNLINQKVLRRQLQARGFEVFVANNGQEAIDAVFERGKTAAENQYSRNYFDCILMDQEMPIKDGNQATSEIRQLQNEGKAGYSKILGVSANVREAQKSSMREAGMDDLISKPFKVDDLIKKVNGLTIGGDDGKGEEGKLAKEAKEGAKHAGPMKGEREAEEEEKRDGVHEEESGAKQQGKQQGEQQEKREHKQTESRKDREAEIKVDGGTRGRQGQGSQQSRQTNGEEDRGPEKKG